MSTLLYQTSWSPGTGIDDAARRDGEKEVRSLEDSLWLGTGIVISQPTCLECLRLIAPKELLYAQHELMKDESNWKLAHRLQISYLTRAFCELLISNII